jgi:hypothetical protein
MRDALANPLRKPPNEPVGIISFNREGTIVYRLRIEVGAYVEYTLSYCPWCGARLRKVGHAPA